MSHIFYDPGFDPARPLLSGSEAHHAFRVLRLSEGNTLVVTDGKGNRWNTRILTAGKVCELQVLESNVESPEPEIHLAVGILQSSDRMEWMVEKLTELGVSRISFVALKRCERKKINSERLKLVSVAALKQSGRSWLPHIDGPLDLEDFLKDDLPALRLVGYLPEKDAHTVSSITESPAPSVVFIGPEGDLTPEEFDLISKNGFQPVRLGHHVLRTETAAIAACCLLRLGTS